MGNKYTKAAQKIEKQQDFKKEQQRLHEKYDAPENSIIKEKSGWPKFFIKLFKFTGSVIFTLLVAIGIMTLYYPQMREDLFLILSEVGKGYK